MPVRVADDTFNVANCPVQRRRSVSIGRWRSRPHPSPPKGAATPCGAVRGSPTTYLPQSLHRWHPRKCCVRLLPLIQHDDAAAQQTRPPAKPCPAPPPRHTHHHHHHHHHSLVVGCWFLPKAAASSLPSSTVRVAAGTGSSHRAAFVVAPPPPPPVPFQSSFNLMSASLPPASALAPSFSW